MNHTCPTKFLDALLSTFFKINFSVTAGSNTRNKEPENGNRKSGKMGNLKTGTL